MKTIIVLTLLTMSMYEDSIYKMHVMMGNNSYTTLIELLDTRPEASVEELVEIGLKRVKGYNRRYEGVGVEDVMAYSKDVDKLVPMLDKVLIYEFRRITKSFANLETDPVDVCHYVGGLKEPRVANFKMTIVRRYHTYRHLVR